jgi:RND family efflux transporter MFP subunit
MNVKKVCIGAIAAIAVGIVLFWVFHRHKPGRSPEPPVTVRNVATKTVHKKDVNDFYEAAGTIQARTISVVSSRIMGVVTDVLVKQGDQVTAGQELLLIDDNDLAQRVKAAQASYEEATKAQEIASSHKALAETTYKRYRQLYDGKALSGQEMDQIANQRQHAELEFQRAQAAVEAAAAGLEQAKISLGFSRITSPIDGVATHKNIDKGSMATPGTPLMTVEDNAGYRVETSVDETMAGRISVSMPVDVAVDSISRTFKAAVSEIVPSIDTTSRTFLVKAGIAQDPNGPSLANGLYARVLIPQKSRSVLAVPATAILRKGQLVGVYVVGDGNRVSYRMIRTGKTFGGDVEALSGLNDGERIVAAGVSSIVEGQVIAADNH